MQDLHRAVQQISDEHRPVAAGRQSQHGRAGSVAGRRLQGEAFVNAVETVPQQGLSGPVDGRDAVLVDQAVDLLRTVPVPVVRTVVEVVGRRNEVLGVGERRYPLPVRADGVPADVVDVEVGVDDDVDILRTDAGPRQEAEEVTPGVVERPHAGPLAQVPRPGVHQDGPARAAQHPALQREHHQAAVRLPVVRCQPALVRLPHLGGSSGEHAGGGQERLVPLDDPDDLDVSQHHAPHTLVLVGHVLDLKNGRVIVPMCIRLKKIRIQLILHTTDILDQWMW